VAHYPYFVENVMMKLATAQKLNIVHVVESLAMGGLEQMVMALAHWQRQQGHASRIVCLFHEGQLADQARQLGIEVWAIHKKSGLDWKALYALRTTLRTRSGKNSLDVIHTHNPVAHYYAAAATLGHAKFRLINTRHGMGRDSKKLDLLYKFALTRTHKAVSVAPAVQDHFIEQKIIPVHKAAVIANGVLIEAIAVRSATAKTQLLTQLGCANTTSVVVGIVGRLNPVKNHASLIHAMAHLRQAGQPVQLVIVGDGPTRPALEALTQSLKLTQYIHFLGMRPDVRTLLSAFDVFVLPSLSEGYSMALVEAAGAALPIVATRVGGNASIVQHEITGLLVPPQNPTALAEALSSLIHDAPLREHMGQAGRQWALTHGTVQTMGQAYMALYQSAS
jgi:glycosyltransferase involved in cell wall biosynthesis